VADNNMVLSPLAAARRPQASPRASRIHASATSSLRIGYAGAPLAKVSSTVASMIPADVPPAAGFCDELK
jgi:hypothetical protein